MLHGVADTESTCKMPRGYRRSKLGTRRRLERTSSFGTELMRPPIEVRRGRNERWWKLPARGEVTASITDAEQGERNMHDVEQHSIGSSPRAATTALLAIAAAWPRLPTIRLVLARDGFFYVGGKPTPVDGRTYMSRPDVRRHPHSGEADASLSDHHGARRHSLPAPTISARPTAAKAGRSISCARATPSTSSISPGADAPAILTEATARAKVADARRRSARATSSQEKYKLWPQAHLHTQWPGNGAPDDAVTLQMIVQATCRRSRISPSSSSSTATRWSRWSTRSARRS